jgi:hypothetical protein
MRSISEENVCYNSKKPALPSGLFYFLMPIYLPSGTALTLRTMFTCRQSNA